MNIANSFLTATQKALQAWTAFLPQLNEYQKRTQFTDFTSLGFPGLTPEAVTALLTEMVEGIEEFLPLLEQDPWFGGMVQEVVSDDKFGQFTSALALDETNQYGQFKAAIPKLKEIRAIIIRNGYGWTLSPKIKSNSDAEKAIVRAVQTLKKQAKDATEAATRTKALSQESEKIFTTITDQIEGIRSTYSTLTQQQLQLGDIAKAIGAAGETATQHLQSVQATKSEIEMIASDIKQMGPQTLAAMKATQLEVSAIAEISKQQRDAAATAASNASTAAADVEKARAALQTASSEATVAAAQVNAAKDEAVTHRNAAKTAAQEVEKLSTDLPFKLQEIAGLRDRAQEVVNNAEHAWSLANRRGLAKAFDDAAKGYRDATFFWFSTFSVFVAAVCWIALEKIVPLATNGKLLDLQSLVLALMSGPLLWGAWIASREISKNGQMRDEYRYKASVAMAFEGYKREAGEVDPALVHKLMEGAVHHFAENPALRVHKSDAPATPLHDALQRLRGGGGSRDAVSPQPQTPSISPVPPIRSIAPAPIGPTAAPSPQGGPTQGQAIALNRRVGDVAKT